MYINVGKALLGIFIENDNLRGELLLHTSTMQYEKLSKQIDTDLDLCREYAGFIAKNTTHIVVEKVKRTVKE